MKNAFNNILCSYLFFFFVSTIWLLVALFITTQHCKGIPQLKFSMTFHKLELNYAFGY